MAASPSKISYEPITTTLRRKHEGGVGHGHPAGLPPAPAAAPSSTRQLPLPQQAGSRGLSEEDAPEQEEASYACMMSEASPRLGRPPAPPSPPTSFPPSYDSVTRATSATTPRCGRLTAAQAGI